MASLIDVTKPLYGNPSTQSVRDNFESAYNEITDLQNKTDQAPYLPIAGGTMDGPIQMQDDPIGPLEVVTKRYVDDLVFGGGAGGVPEAPLNGFYYARGNIPAGSEWSANPMFSSVHFGIVGPVTDRFNIGTDATYNRINYTPTNTLRYNRTTNALEMSFNNVVMQSWSATLNAVNNLTIASNSPTLHLNSPTIADEYIYLETNGLKRWAIGADVGASGFGIFNYDAAGAVLGKTLSIDKTTGSVSLVAARSPAGFIVDQKGNVGIGFVPPTNQAAANSTNSSGGWLFNWGLTANNWLNNGYYDGTNFRYLNAGTLWNASMFGTSFSLGYAPSGAKDAIATPATLMTLTSTGALTVNALGVGSAIPANSANGWLFSGGVSSWNYGTNIYHDGTNWRYNTSYGGGMIANNQNGGMFFYSSVPGTAGNIAPLINAMTINSLGNVEVYGILNANKHVLSVQPGGNGFVGSHQTGNSAVGMWNYNNVLYFGNADGNGVVVTPSRMSIDPSGNIATSGSINASVASISGNIFGGRIRATNSFMSDTGIYYFANNENYYMGRASSTGVWYLVENGNANISCDPSGNTNIRGNLNANGNISGVGMLCTTGVASGMSYAVGGHFTGGNGDTSFGFYSGGSGRVFQFSPSWYWDWNNQTGTLIWNNPSAGPEWVIHANGSCYNSANWTGGRGPFVDLNSSRTLKREIVTTSYGLEDILKLNPVSFRRLRDNDPTELGFIAEEMLEIIPELIMSNYLIGKDGNEETEPTLGITITQLIPVLVNAIKQLNSRLITIEGHA